jgi:hypothetical protein
MPPATKTIGIDVVAAFAAGNRRNSCRGNHAYLTANQIGPTGDFAALCPVIAL